MSYDKMTTSKLSVAAANVLHLTPGGYYNLKDGNRVETAVAKLHILQKHIEMAIESYCDSSENTIRLGDKMDKLASELFEQYETYIEEGVDPFKFQDYELERTNLGDAYILTQLAALDTDRSRKALASILRLFDVSRSTADGVMHVYLHDRKSLSMALHAAFREFEDVLDVDYDTDAECVYIKMPE